MSRSYELRMFVTGYNPAKVADISAVAAEECEVDLFEYKGELTGGGCTQLFMGDSESDYTKYVTKKIWEANGSPCKVRMRMINLEELPYEDYKYDESDKEDISNVKTK